MTITGDTGQVTFVMITGGTGTGVTFAGNVVGGSLTIIHNHGTVSPISPNTVSGTTTIGPNP